MYNKEAGDEAENLLLKNIIEPADVLLAVSPTVGVHNTFFGLHSLQASCLEAGISTRVFYPNLIYSNLIGQSLHDNIAGDFTLQLGERIFAFAAFGLPHVSIGRHKHKFMDSTWVPDHIWQVKRHGKDGPIPAPVVSYKQWLDTVDLENLEAITTGWINALARQIVDIGFRIVGGSTTFGGLVPAVALLTCIKKAAPDIITILGGTYCEGEMAEGILSLNAGIDYVFSGEGEITFPTLARQILESRLPKEKIVQGEYVHHLDSIPMPDYRDYTLQKAKFHANDSLGKNKYAVGFETSRGCSYGKCTFCGFSGKKNIYRCKSPQKIIQDLRVLKERHGKNLIIIADSNLPSQYFDTLIPRLANEITDINIEYSVKTDLSLEQVIALKKAGVNRLLIGIESLSNSMLKLMRKGVTLRENIAALRYVRILNIGVTWNLLFGLPGDQKSQYEETLHLFTLMHHLHPPFGIFPIVLHRFSKYQRDPGMFGISNIRPGGVFREMLPLHADIDKIAYFFRADIPSQSRENPGIINALGEEFQAWHKAWAAYETIQLDMFLPNLHVSRKTSDLYVLVDTRGLPGNMKKMELNREQASLLLVARPMEEAPDLCWALDAGLGVEKDLWFIPLATAAPELLQEFENEYQF